MPNSPRSAGNDRPRALGSAPVPVLRVKTAGQQERPFPGLPCAEGENGRDEAWRRGGGGEPF